MPNTLNDDAWFTLVGTSYEFLVLQRADGVQSWALGGQDGVGRWRYTLQDPAFANGLSINAIALEHTSAVLGYQTAASARLSAVQFEFGSNASLADFSDLQLAWSLVGSSLVDFLDLKEINLPDIGDYYGKWYNNEGPFITYGGQTHWGDRAFFISPHDGVVPYDWLVHDNIASHQIDVGSSLYNRQVLAKVTYENAGVAPITFLDEVSLTPGGGGRSVFIADLDQDENLDLIGTDLNGQNIVVMKGRGNGTFDEKVIYQTDLSPNFSNVADFNGDGLPDIVITNTYNSNLSLFLNDGDGVFGRYQTFFVGETPTSLAISDFNNDRIFDVIVANESANKVTILSGDGLGNFVISNTLNTQNNPLSVAASDFNADGYSDIVIAEGNRISVLLGNGDATFQSRLNYGTGSGPHAVAVADFNNDNKQDIVTANYGGSISVFLNRGDGTFNPGRTYLTVDSPNTVAVGDLDGDNFIDIVTGNYSRTISIWRGVGDGTFNSSEIYHQNSYPLNVAIADLNGDHKNDIIKASDHSDAMISVLINNSNFWQEFSISADSPIKAEGNFGVTDFTFTITRRGYVNEAANVSYIVPAFWDASEADFFEDKFATDTVNFLAGETAKNITVSVKGDTFLETDEYFLVKLVNPSSGAALGTATATAKIVNDDKLILTPNDGESGDFFGIAVDLSSDGRTAIVGGYADNVGSNTYQGSARVFDWSGYSWVERGGPITPLDAKEEDGWFGFSVAMADSGLSVVIGGPTDSPGPTGAYSQGSARVFDWNGTAWVQRGGALTPLDGAYRDLFGRSVDISSDGLTVIVGGPDDDVGQNEDQGSAIVFDWDGFNWVQRGAVVTPVDGSAGDYFGHSVGLSDDGNTAILSGPFDDMSGSTRIFDWDRTTWVQRGNEISNGAARGSGYSSSLSGDCLNVIVGEIGYYLPSSPYRGSARVLYWNGENWVQRGDALIASVGGAQDNFGYSVELANEGFTAIVGAPNQDVSEKKDQGCAWVFDWNGSAWIQRGSALTPDDGRAEDRFGSSVALSEDGLTALVGGPGDKVDQNAEQGSARIFRWNGTQWVEGVPSTGSGMENDLIIGGPIENIMVAGPGNDSFLGGYGIDTADYTTFGSGIYVDLSALAQVTRLRLTGSPYRNDEWILFVDGVGSVTYTVQPSDENGSNIVNTATHWAAAINESVLNSILTATADNSGFIFLEEKNVGGGFDFSASVVDVVSSDSRQSLAIVVENIVYPGRIESGNEHDYLQSIENIIGTSFADTISGSAGVNSLIGGPGGDSIMGLGGNDTLTGGNGNDTLLGGDGDDFLNGGAGNDIMNASVGSDAVDYTAASSGISVNLSANAQATRLILTGSTYSNDEWTVYIDGVGAVTYVVQPSDEEGSNIVNLATNWAAAINASALNSILTATVEIVGGSTTILLQENTASGGFDCSASVVDATTSDNSQNYPLFIKVETIVYPGQMQSGDENDLLISVENIIGTSFDDTISGAAGANSLIGGSGADSISGLGGDDILLGGDDADTLLGDAGDDSLIGGNGNDILDGGAGYNTLAGGLGNDTYYVSGWTRLSEAINGGIDTLISTVGIINLPSNIENIILQGSNPLTATGNLLDNSITGNSGNNSLYGNDGNDSLFGLTGTDYLEGGNGNDFIDAGEGNDTLIGGAGDDTLLGGSGRDRFDGNPGNNLIIGGGGGDDYVSYSNGIQGSLGVTVNLVTGIATNTYGGVDTLFDIRGIHGSREDDILVGSDKLSGEVGLSGYPSNGTTFWASLGSDQINGTLPLASNNIYYNVSFFNEATILVEFSDYDSATVTKSLGGVDSLTNVQGVHGTIGNDILKGSPTTGPSGTFYNSISLHGRQGNDTIYGYGLTVNRADYSSATAAISVNLAAGTAEDGLGGTDSLINVVRIRGSNFNDTIVGGNANDVIETPTLGSHFLDGAGGVNQYRFSNGNWTTPDSVLIDLGTTLAPGGGYQGFVIKQGGITDTLIRFNQARGSDGDDSIYGTPGDDKLIGLAGNNILDGRGGSNTLEYGAAFAGSVSTQGVSVDLNSGQAINQWGGTDRISNFQSVIGTPFADTLLGGAANETLEGGAGEDTLSGGDGNDSLLGGDGNDTLDGGSGTNTLEGGAGDDAYYVYGSNTIIESSGAGVDVVRSSVSIAALAANVENLVLHGSLGLSATGNLIGNTITGNSGSNSINGAAGNDTLLGLDGADYLDGGVDNDILDGGIGNDTLLGGDGLDTLSGGAGADSLVGSAGNDWVSYAASTSGVTVNLTTGLGAGGDAAGDKFSTIEAVMGSGFADSLIGSGLADTLDGGAGNDTLVGGAGNDTYLVNSSGDVITEASGQGTDLVIASASYTIGANVENLTLTGDGAISGTGNTLNNLIAGNGAANTLDGGTGSDTLTGGAGDDIYVVDNAGDQVIEVSGGGNDLVQSSISYTLAANVENLTLTGSAGIIGTGNALNNVIVGNSAANTLVGGAGMDTLQGGAGNDTYDVDDIGDVVIESAGGGTDLVRSLVSYTLAAEVENLTLMGTASISGAGNGLNNQLTGNTAANTLDGGAGADTLVGGGGNDTYVVDSDTDVITEASGQGTDIALASVSYTIGANVENLTLTGSSAINGTGNTLNNLITGNEAANTLDGGTGVDTLTGGAGNDTYIVDNTGDKVIEVAGGGTDLVQSSISYTLAAEVENLTLTGSAAIAGTGNALNNVIVGNSAANTLTGDAGMDTLQGGAGNDTYDVDDIGDLVIESVSGGTDLVRSLVSYTLAAEVENLTLMGTSSISGAGNGLNNQLTGNTAANTLDGGAGADTLVGGGGNDTYVVDSATDVITEASGQGTDIALASVTYTIGTNVENLTLTGSAAINGTGNTLNNLITGNSAANILNGGDGLDTLDGGAGADTLVGGAGNDTYLVGDTGDVLTEVAGAGTDLVQSSISYTLGANLENLTLLGGANINGTGNTLNNVLTGNSGANVLDGGTGADSMLGGAGDDTYVVDNTGDRITENSGQGTDLVLSSISWTLGSNLENLTLTGSTAISGTGNSDNNRIIGNAAANTIDGGAGADTLDGGAGNDTYAVDNIGDVVIEASAGGTDVIRSTVSYTLSAEVENLFLLGSATINGTGNGLANQLTGTSGANVLDGGAGNDSISGGDGADTLMGGLGADTLTGGTGADRFALSFTAESGLVAGDWDVITDFNRSQGDRIDLSQIDAVSSSAGSNETFSYIGSAAFDATNAAGQLRWTYSAALGGVVVYGSDDADSLAECALLVKGVTSLMVTDFIL